MKLICAYEKCREKEFESSRPDARYCSDSCRAAAWKERRGYGVARPVRTEPSRPSGLQVSYHRAVREVAKVLEGYGSSPAVALRRAEVTLARALPERQRQRLEART